MSASGRNAGSGAGAGVASSERRPRNPEAADSEAADRQARDRQAASAVLMVRPDHFGSNPETLESNRLQRAARATADLRNAARAEFESLALKLHDSGVTVHVFSGRAAPRASPDEVFPNNWLSTHADGTVALYPLMAPSRRLERRAEIIAALREAYEVRRVVDLTGFERNGAFLEGTGSLVLDRPARSAFACSSPRTSEAALRGFEAALEYDVHSFAAVDSDSRPIYHTNVMLSLGTRFAVVCGESLPDPGARRGLFEKIEASGRSIVDIGFDAMASFAANVLELEGRSGPLLALSTRAWASLAAEQRRTLEVYAEPCTADVGTIETYGGGGVRCMLAEIHLPRRLPEDESARGS